MSASLGLMWHSFLAALILAALVQHIYLITYSLLPFKAVKIGVDGIFVSNHGARQLDTVPAREWP